MEDYIKETKKQIDRIVYDNTVIDRVKLDSRTGKADIHFRNGIEIKDGMVTINCSWGDESEEAKNLLYLFQRTHYAMTLHSIKSHERNKDWIIRRKCCGSLVWEEA